MNHSLYQRSVTAIEDFTERDLLFLFKLTDKMKKNPPDELLKGLILATCFFEPSTRTRLSFEAAMIRLGGQVIGFADGMGTSHQKGESLVDTIRVIGGYADLIVLRHPQAGSAYHSSLVTKTPVINAGDGSNQHPTQALQDLYTIQECQGKLQGLSIAFVGDLKYGRTAHSLAIALAHFGARLFFVSSEALQMPEHICQILLAKGISYSVHVTIEEVIEEVDILYMTRIQKERFQDKDGADPLILRVPLLAKAKNHLKILHPLPRVNEIDDAVDQTPFAYYFEQAHNGLYVRQALLAAILTKDLPL